MDSINLHHLKHVTTFIAHFLISAAHKVQRRFFNLFLRVVFLPIDIQALYKPAIQSSQCDFMAGVTKNKK